MHRRVLMGRTSVGVPARAGRTCRWSCSMRCPGRFPSPSAPKSWPTRRVGPAGSGDVARAPRRHPGGLLRRRRPDGVPRRVRCRCPDRRAPAGDRVAARRSAQARRHRALARRSARARHTLAGATASSPARVPWRAVSPTGLRRSTGASAGRQSCSPASSRDPRPAYASADIVLGNAGSALRGLAFGKPTIVLGEAGYSEVVSPESAAAFAWRGFYGIGADEGPLGLAGPLRRSARGRARRERSVPSRVGWSRSATASTLRWPGWTSSTEPRSRSLSRVHESSPRRSGSGATSQHGCRSEQLRSRRLTRASRAPTGRSNRLPVADRRAAGSAAPGR